jgi:hypothetical protein
VRRLWCFVNNGPGSNGAHWDAIGGYSSLIDGFKLFVCWDVRSDHDDNRHWHGGLVDLEALVNDKSMWWALVGPNSTILLEADQAHFVLTFSSSVLVTWARTYYPSHIFASLCTIFEGNLKEGDPTWDIETNSRRKEVLRLMCGILHASAAKIRGWQRQGEAQRVRKLVQGWDRSWQRRLQRDLFGVVAHCRLGGAHAQRSGEKVEQWVELMDRLGRDPMDGSSVDEFLAGVIVIDLD